ncbi:hypothetical protein GQ53DRAFT_612588, partial [Thozetella sp. PMI_491]
VEGTGDPRFIICVDYGTTRTGVAWILTHGGPVTLQDIQVVTSWPARNDPKVPSLFTYAANDTGRRWGFNIGDDAYVIRLTKMKLGRPNKRLLAVENLAETADEARFLPFEQDYASSQLPRHLTRTPGDVVADYLQEVAVVVRDDMENIIDPHILRTMQFPIDLIVTIPAIWDYRAKNLTFRAVQNAFRLALPEMSLRPGLVRMATEPEACAQYTMLTRPSNSLGRLRVGECFIVVDAGGGTVDLVSYLVEKIEPEFLVSRLTIPSSGKFGATLIDHCFLYEFLRARLTKDDYDKLLKFGCEGTQFGQGGHGLLRPGEKMLFEQFEPLKNRFRGPARAGEQEDGPFILSLPTGIGERDDPNRGISGGQLYISCTDMQEMFRDSVDGITNLIQQQLQQIDDLRPRRTVRTIFLSGGYSRNEYLCRCVNKLAERWGFGLFKGDDCWTAVARGGVIMGLGIDCTVPPAVRECPYSIGIVLSEKFTSYNHDQAWKYTDTLDKKVRARSCIKWLVSKGDLIHPEEPHSAELRLTRKF